MLIYMILFDKKYKAPLAMKLIFFKTKYSCDNNDILYHLEYTEDR